MEAVLRKMKDGDGRYLMVQDWPPAWATPAGPSAGTGRILPWEIEAGKDVLMVGDSSAAYTCRQGRH